MPEHQEASPARPAPDAARASRVAAASFLIERYGANMVGDLAAGFRDDPEARPADVVIDLTGQPGGRAVIGYEVFAVYRAGTNPLISAGVENLTEQLLDALGRTASWLVTQIGAPVDLATAAGTFPAVRCVTTHSATITTD